MPESTEDRNLREFREIHHATTQAGPKGLPARTADQVWNAAEFERAGGVGGKSTPLNEMKWNAANFREVKQLIIGLQAAHEASTKALVGAIQAINQGEAFDAEKLVSTIRADVAAGVKEGLGNLKVTGDLSNVRIEAGPEEVAADGDS